MFLDKKVPASNMIHQPSTNLEKLLFQYFPHTNVLESQSNLFAGKAKIYLGSSLEQIW